jgi:succinate-acetate transporter protein
MVDYLTSVESVTQRNLRGSRAIASPWVLGLYALAGATFLLATRMAGWDGARENQFLLFPFSTVLGGLVLLAGMWAFETSDRLATVMLGIWGSFWIAYGILVALFMSGKLPEPAGAFPELGFWYVVLAVITWVGAVAALSESAALVVTLGFLAAGATVAAIANFADRGGLELVGGWLFIVSAVIGWYTATAMMFAAAFGRPVLPIGSCASSAAASSSAERAGEQGSPARQTPAAAGRVG